MWDHHITLWQVLPLCFSPLPGQTPPLLHMPSSLSPRRGGQISTHFSSKYSWRRGPTGPLTLHSWHLPDLKSSWLHCSEVTPSGHKKTTPFLLLTSVLNFSSVPAHSPSYMCPQQEVQFCTSTKFLSISPIGLGLFFFFFFPRQWGGRRAQYLSIQRENRK